jgi:hypothetical protein
MSPMNEEFMREWQEMKESGEIIDDHHHDEINESED